MGAASVTRRVAAAQRGKEGATLLLNGDECRIDTRVAELFRGVFRIFASFERADADAVDHLAALLALGETALDAQHRQLGALLLRVFAARVSAGLHEVREGAGGERRRGNLGGLSLIHISEPTRLLS